MPFFHKFSRVYQQHSAVVGTCKIFLPPTKAATANCFGFFRLKYNLLGGCMQGCTLVATLMLQGCITKGFNYSCRVPTTTMPHIPTLIHTPTHTHTDKQTWLYWCFFSILHASASFISNKGETGSLVGLFIVCLTALINFRTHIHNELYRLLSVCECVCVTR